MQLRHLPYTLRLKRTFSISSSSRSTTPAVLVEISHEQVSGYGEASLPPYRSETQQSVARFIKEVRLPEPDGVEGLDPLLDGLERQSDGDHAARAAVDMALHDWFGKRYGFGWARQWGLDPSSIPPTSFTIGIATPDEIRSQVAEAREFASLKIKLGTEHDKEIIGAVRDVSDQTIRVDVNQGWEDRSHALMMIDWLASRNVELVEQPLPRNRHDDIRWLRERSPIPIVADESVERYGDIAGAAEMYHGINIKLMKCGGLREARRMILAARRLGLKVMLGCMTETTCAISAAAQLAPLADWIDLDGALLIGNDPFSGVEITEGRIRIPDSNGNGVVPRSEFELPWREC